MEHFCTCQNLACKLHPQNHAEGCTPCIRANLKTHDIPTCFFALVPGSEARKADAFEDFAKAVLGGAAPRQNS